MKILLPILTFLLLSSCSLILPKPSDSVEAFYKNLCDGNIEGAQKYISATSKATPELTRSGFREIGGICKDQDGLDHVEITDERIEGETAFVSGRALYKNGTDTHFNLKMYYEQNVWKLADKDSK